MEKKIDVFDTTLRDGEQAPGNKMVKEDKLRVARKLADLNVDIVEAGFPVSSPGDFESVAEIAKMPEMAKREIVGLARAIYYDKPVEIAGIGKKTGWVDIDRAWEAIKYAENPKIHIFMGTSPIHRKYKFGDITLKEATKRTVDAVRYIHKLTNGHAKIEVSAEDAGRTDNKDLVYFSHAVAKEGIGVFNVPDTVGYCQPDEFGEKVKAVVDTVKGYKVKTSVHCHNDLGLATANTLSGVINGAEQVEVTMLGIGERAGNTSLEQFVMNLLTRKDYYEKHGNPYTEIKTEELGPSARILSSIIGMEMPPTAPIVGGNAFAHLAGIHSAGVLADSTTYEIMDKETVGWIGENIVAGSHMGKKSLNDILKKLGYSPKREEVDKLFGEVKSYADKMRVITHTDVEAIYRRNFMSEGILYDVNVRRFGKNADDSYFAEVIVHRNGARYSGEVGLDIDHEESKMMTGPVDAVITAIKKGLTQDQIIDKAPTIATFMIKATGAGSGALGMANITTQNKYTCRGNYSSADIVIASAKAYINSVNQAIWQSQK